MYKMDCPIFARLRTTKTSKTSSRLRFAGRCRNVRNQLGIPTADFVTNWTARDLLKRKAMENVMRTKRYMWTVTFWHMFNELIAGRPGRQMELQAHPPKGPLEGGASWSFRGICQDLLGQVRPLHTGLTRLHGEALRKGSPQQPPNWLGAQTVCQSWNPWQEQRVGWVSSLRPLSSW